MKSLEYSFLEGLGYPAGLRTINRLVTWTLKQGWGEQLSSTRHVPCKAGDSDHALTSGASQYPLLFPGL